MKYRLVKQSNDMKPLIVYPKRGVPPTEPPLEGYERDPSDPYIFRPKQCKYLYYTCSVKSCCTQQIINCVLHGAIELKRCDGCKDKVIE